MKYAFSRGLFPHDDGVVNFDGVRFEFKYKSIDRRHANRRSRPSRCVINRGVLAFIIHRCCVLFGAPVFNHCARSQHDGRKAGNVENYRSVCVSSRFVERASTLWQVFASFFFSSWPWRRGARVPTSALT